MLEIRSTMLETRSTMLETRSAILIKGYKKRAITRPFFFHYFLEILFLRNCVCRAVSLAGTTLQALVLIDFVMNFTHVDSFSRAICCAGPTGQAIITNNEH
jgi:hypothetical protein